MKVMAKKYKEPVGRSKKKSGEKTDHMGAFMWFITILAALICFRFC